MARLKQGRRKIQIAPITQNERRLVTFSKRRFGLFKKASELSTLCGVDLALIVFSPGNKVFSYGNPSVESIVDRYLGRYNPHNSYHVPTNQHNNVQINIPQVNYLNMQLNEVVRQLDVEKRHHDQKERKKERQVMNWWEGPVENLTLNQLEELKIGLEDVKSTVEKMKMEVSAAETLAAWPCIPPHENALGHVAHNIGAGSSSSMTLPGGYALVNYGAGSSMVRNGFAPSSSFDEGQSSSSSFNVMNDTVVGSAINPNEYLNLQGFGGSFF